MNVPKPTGYRGGPDGQTGYTVDVARGHTIFTPFFDRATRIAAELHSARREGVRLDHPNLVARLEDIVSGRDTKIYHWRQGRRGHVDPPRGCRVARLNLPDTDDLNDWYWMRDTESGDDDFELEGPFRTRGEAIGAAWAYIMSEIGS